MPPIRDQAICIRHWDWSETSQTVSLFGREHGIIRGLAKGAKREKGTFSGGIELLTRGEVLASVKPGRELSTLMSWDLQELFPVLARRLDAHHAGLYIADVVGRMITDSDPHPGLFDAMLLSLRALNRVDGGRTARIPGYEGGLLTNANGSSAGVMTTAVVSGRELVERILLRFQWRLLDETGYRPEVERDPETRQQIDGTLETLGFSAGLGGFVNDAAGPNRWKTRAETWRCLKAVAGEPMPDGGGAKGQEQREQEGPSSEAVRSDGEAIAGYPDGRSLTDAEGAEGGRRSDANGVDDGERADALDDGRRSGDDGGGASRDAPTGGANRGGDANRRGFEDAAERWWSGPVDRSPAEAVRRANRLLAAYVRTILDFEPPTLRYVFGSLDVGNAQEPPRGGRHSGR